jgi:hypothetical protein
LDNEGSTIDLRKEKYSPIDKNNQSGRSKSRKFNVFNRNGDISDSKPNFRTKILRMGVNKDKYKRNIQNINRDSMHSSKKYLDVSI